MTSQVAVRSNLRIAGAIVLDQNVSEFPEGKIGMLVVKGSNLYAYVLFNGLETWYPIIRNVSKTAIHTQTIPSTVWTVSTNFDNSTYWFQAKNAAGEIEYPATITDVDTNTVKLTFSEAVSGTAFFVGVNDLDVSEVKASVIKVGTGVVITDSDVTINGVSVLSANGVTIAQVDAKIATASALLAPIAGSSGNDFSTKDLTVSGDLVVNGDTVTVNSTTVTTADNVITLNSGEVGDGVTKGSAGIEIDRGSSAKYLITFDESDDLFKVGVTDDLEIIATRPYVATTISAAIATEVTDRNTAIATAVAAGDKVGSKTFTGAITCDYVNDGAYIAGTVTAATTITITGVPNDGKAYGMTFELTNAGTNVTWPAAVTWLGNTPTLRASGVSMVTLVTRNGGTTYYGSAA